MERLIQGKGQAVLNVCGCSKLHFTYGPITLHFDQEEFLTFADAVNHAAAHLRHTGYQRGPVALPGGNGTACH
jgi:hypothetical protein